jgi:hypothetical protein
MDSLSERTNGLNNTYASSLWLNLRRLSASSATDIMEGPEPCNTLSSGKDTLKVTTPGNQPHKFMPQIS